MLQKKKNTQSVQRQDIVTPICRFVSEEAEYQSAD